jgi:hypothetical protein
LSFTARPPTPDPRTPKVNVHRSSETTNGAKAGGRDPAVALDNRWPPQVPEPPRLALF